LANGFWFQLFNFESLPVTDPDARSSAANDDAFPIVMVDDDGMEDEAFIGML